MRRDELKAAPENRRGPSVAGARQFRAFAGAAPALPARNRHPGGGGAPPGGTMASCQELADGGVDAAESAARRRKENAAAERREARRSAIRPVISGDPEIDLAARRVTGAAFRTSACRRSASLIFFWKRRTGKGHPPPLQRAGVALAV